MSDDSGASVRTADLRRAPRHATHKTLEIKRVGAPKNASQHLIELVDCSLNGIGLMSAVPLAAGEEFIISIKLDTLSELIFVVRHCRPAESGRYKIGAEFVGLATPGANADRQRILEALLLPE